MNGGWQQWAAALILQAAAAAAAAAPVLALERTTPAAMGLGQTAVFELHLLNAGSALGAFSLQIGYDAGVLSYDAPAAFGSHLGLPDVDALGLVDASTPGLLAVDEVSLLTTPDLLALQTDTAGVLLDDLLLATFSFTGQGLGASAVSFKPGSLVFSDADGNVLPAPEGVSAVVQVVPEPATLSLVALAAALAAAGTSGAARRRAPRPAGAGPRSCSPGGAFPPSIAFAQSSGATACQSCCDRASRCAGGNDGFRQPKAPSVTVHPNA